MNTNRYNIRLPDSLDAQIRKEVYEGKKKDKGFSLNEVIVKRLVQSYEESEK